MQTGQDLLVPRQAGQEQDDQKLSSVGKLVDLRLECKLASQRLVIIQA